MVIKLKSGVRGVVYIVTAAFLWGFYPVFTRLLFDNGVSAMQIVSARAQIAGLIYLIVGLFYGVFKGLRPKDYFFLSLFGCCSIMCTYIFYSLAQKYLSTGAAAMLLYTAPAFVILYDRIFCGVKITKLKILSLTAAFIGSFLVIRAYQFGSLSFNLLGVLFGILSGFFYSTLTIIGRKAVKRGYTPLQNTIIPAVAVGIIFAAAIPVQTLPLTSPKIVFCFLAVGILGSVLPYFFYQKGLSCGIDGATASILSYVEPITATLFGIWVFRDTLEAAQIAGVIAVIAGAVIPSLGNIEPFRRLSAKHSGAGGL